MTVAGPAGVAEPAGRPGSRLPAEPSRRHRVLRPAPSPTRSAAPVWAALAALCCLAGFALRARGLGEQSLWLDEGASYWFARLPAGALIAATFSSEPNPPLYYLLLHAWLGWAGASEYTLRFPSLLAGVLTIALLYRLGRDLLSPPAVAAAAILAAVSPYLIWYAQEARIYALLGCLSASTLLLLWRAVRRPSRRAWCRFALLLLAALYTHAYALFLLLVCAAWLLVVRATGATGRRGWRGAAPGVALPVLLYLPWLAATLRHGDHGGWRAPTDLAQVARVSAAAFAHNGFLSGARGDALTLAEVLLAAAGLALAARYGRGRRPGAALLLLALVLPALAVATLSRREPIFGVNYVIGQAPVFLLAVAAGVALPLRAAWLGLPGALVLAAGSLLALQQGRLDPTFRHEDFRDAARYVERAAAPGDTVVLLAEYARLPFGYYYRGSAQVAPFSGNPERPGESLQPLADQSRVLWLLLSHAEQVDPKGQVKAWLDARYPLATEQFPKSIRVYGYRAQYRLAALPSGVAPLQRHFGPALELAGFTAQSGIPPTDLLFHPPSNWLHVELYWRALAPPAAAYRSSVRLVDARGVWGAELERPGSALRLYPTTRWRTAEIVVDDEDVNLNPATPPGAYRLEVRLLDPAGRPLPTTDPLLPGSVVITAP